MQSQKTTQAYRRDIFTLKNRIKQQEQYLQQLKQKCSQIDIFSQQSYTFQMKMKILQNDLIEVKQRIEKYRKDQYGSYYQFNFCVYSMRRSCQILGFKMEMVYRMIDVSGKGIVKALDFSNFLRDVLRLDSILINPIIIELDPKETGEIAQIRYKKLLKVFLLDSQPPTQKQPSQKQQKIEIQDSIERICNELIRSQVPLKSLWRTEIVNIALVAGMLKKKMEKLDNLDCYAVYCKCDPIKNGVVESAKVIEMLEREMEKSKRFDSTGLKKIKLKQ